MASINLLRILIFLLGVFLWITIYVNHKYKKIKKDIRVLSTSFAFVLVFFSLFPNFAVAISKFFGVPRATDLFVYLMIPFLFYLNIILYTIIREEKTKFTEFVRREAINEFKEKYKERLELIKKDKK